ncbi:hypothetical protein [Conexivisphaera calida]|uniref:5-methyltetrahydropteroyltriglutamate--homocysteine methyltransferase n=1 Tax=Conexivisphaera calida TaxID=1874277 RepID=A0A4P2VAF0_9ARCH|nr:hypothetical protein [Conexivisphaera calida]BBE41446.1 5-methyltetrahydropteroyltriglutamate--homocysteine methyltransferase [Conexivisphaera calida]
MRAYTFGIYPRPLRLIAATRRDPEGSRELARRESTRILALQDRAGLPLLSDPLLEWDDMLRWFAAEWDGVEVNGIIRYFEHNAFYRVPVVKGKIRSSGEVLRRHLVVRERGRSILEIPEPVTFALMSKDLHYGSIEPLALDIARALNDEICPLEKELEPALIVVKGPALVHGNGPGMAEVVARAAEDLLRSCRAPGVLHMYFKSPIEAYRAIKGIRSAYSGVGLDATWDPIEKLSEELKGYRMEKLSLGLVNSQNTKVEHIGDVMSSAEMLGKAAGGPEVLVTVSSDLEFIPYSFAVKKLRILGRVAGGA